MGKRSEKRREAIRQLRKELNKTKTVKEIPLDAPKLPWYQKPISKITATVIFAFDNLWGAAMLNALSPIATYLIFIVINCVVLGFWAWIFADWLQGHSRYIRLYQISCALVVIFAFLFTVQYTAIYAIRPQTNIEIQPYTPDSTVVNVHYGNKHEGYPQNGDAITTIGDLKQNPWVSLKINKQEIFSIHIVNNAISIDTLVFAGIQNPTLHLFNAPIVVKDNAPDRLPDGWRIYKNGNVFEIDNADGIPVLLMEYKNPQSVTISGLFITPMGICRVDNQKEVVYLLGDTLSELGSYKIDSPFFVNRPFFTVIHDLLYPERTFDLSKY